MFNILYVWCPLIFVSGLAVAALVLATFNQTNQAYQRFIFLLIIGFAVSVGLVMIAFISSSAGFYAFASILCNAVSGALKLCLFEFMTEIIFPVSPVFGLGILNTISGLLSLIISMFSMDIVITNPTSNDFVYLVLVICLMISVATAFIFF